MSKPELSNREGLGIELELHRELPVVTAYLLRHGETTEDKLNPNRGLTKKGEEQADAAAEKLIAELDPNQDVIQLFDSGNHRANVTVMRIAEKLKEAGFAFFKPIKNLGRGEREGELETTSEPKAKTYHRVRAADIPEEFKKKLADPELHKKLGIPDNVPDKRVLAWFLSDWPDEVEKPAQVTQRVREGMRQTSIRLPALAKCLGEGRRIVTLVAGNATVIDVMVDSELKLKALDNEGGTENCEGVKIDFVLGKEKPKILPWGEKIEENFSTLNLD
ncbi:MAG: histidine phosphatase family protein [Candidatus Magasanikbacteria bacterium]|nr:histidine phosphatase family protein [Candidatus Magasanikbacteria bacterium]